MTLCLFSTFFFVLFLNLSMGSLRLTQLNRTFMNSYKGMYEACVVTVGNDGEPIKPYFEQNLLESYVADYLEPNISKYVTDYDLHLLFIDVVLHCLIYRMRIEIRNEHEIRMAPNQFVVLHFYFLVTSIQKKIFSAGPAFGGNLGQINMTIKPIYQLRTSGNRYGGNRISQKMILLFHRNVRIVHHLRRMQENRLLKIAEVSAGIFRIILRRCSVIGFFSKVSYGGVE